MPEIAASDTDSIDLVEKELKRRSEKKQKRRELLIHRAQAYIPPVQEETEDHRDAGYKIMKNKGLTRIRKKENRNSRVKYRNKYEDAVMRRKGQVQDVIREGPADGTSYLGEETGIRTHLKKSVRIS
jgi:ribosomal protein S21